MSYNIQGQGQEFKILPIFTLTLPALPSQMHPDRVMGGRFLPQPSRLPAKRHLESPPWD